MSASKWVGAVLLAAVAAACVTSGAAAAEKKSVLIYGRTLGFRHKDAIEKGSPILKRLAEELGYQATISEDPAMFDPGKVEQWDLIIFNNCTGRLNPKAEERRNALMGRIRGGAGFMGFHSATDCNYNWPEYGEMMNAYFSGHPWNQVVHSRIEDPEHPLMKPFGGKPFVMKDEIYQFIRAYKRSSVRVLMSIDTRSVNASRGGRKDRDYAICWIRPWGKGRVFYNAHGHYGHVFEDKTFQEHVKLAMQWAIGDIEVDTTPSKEIDKAALAAKAIATLGSATADEPLMQALDVLSWCPRAEALPKVVALLERNQKVAAVAADATQAIVAVAELPKERKIELLKQALPCATSRTVRKAIRGQLKALGVTDLPINVPPGFIAHWWVIGPFPNPQKPQPHGMFDKAYPPEETVDLAQTIQVGNKKLAWKKVETDDDGIVNFNEALRRASNVGGYMYAEVTAAQDADVELRLGSDDGFVLWLNGQRVAGKKLNRGIKPGQDKIKAKLKAGTNQILMKVLQGGGDWAGCLQIVGPKGGKVDFQVRTR